MLATWGRTAGRPRLSAGMGLLARVRWRNVGRAALVAGVVVGVVAWPRLSVDVPRVPGAGVGSLPGVGERRAGKEAARGDRRRALMGGGRRRRAVKGGGRRRRAVK